MALKRLHYYQHFMEKYTVHIDSKARIKHSEQTINEKYSIVALKYWLAYNQER